MARPLAAGARAALLTPAGEGRRDSPELRLASGLLVCCGFHDGSPARAREALQLARRLRKGAGALPGYPDRAGRGMRSLTMSSTEIRDLVRHQVRDLARTAESLGMRLRHVGLHGALRAQALRDDRIARAAAHGVLATWLGLPMLAPPGTALARAATLLGIPVIPEAVASSAPAARRLRRGARAIRVPARLLRVLTPCTLRATR